MGTAITALCSEINTSHTSIFSAAFHHCKGIGPESELHDLLMFMQIVKIAPCGVRLQVLVNRKLLLSLAAPLCTGAAAMAVRLALKFLRMDHIGGLSVLIVRSSVPLPIGHHQNPMPTPID